MTMTATPAARLQPISFTRIGWVLSGLAIVFLLFDGAIKLVPLQVVLDTMAPLGIPADLARTLGVLTIACTVLYAVPATAFLGAILLTAYMGGAIATHMNAGSPLFTHALFGVYLALFIWGGLWFRSPALRNLLPLVRQVGSERT